MAASLRNAVSRFPLPRLRLFSSSAAATPRARNFFSDGIDGEESAVYKHTLKFQKPSTITRAPKIYNSVSFIGTADFPLTRFNTHGGASFGLHTFLNVSTSSACKNPFKIKLKMWGDVAELSLKHLRQNDLIYVSGNLTSYVMTGHEGNPRLFHEVIVKEINFVAGHSKAPTCREGKKAELSDEDRAEMNRRRLHLWQVFFSSPYEWWDNREKKLNSKAPDFKHKNTGEALWLKQDDPSWIRRQLELLDSTPVRKDSGNSQVSPLTYDI
ncbi:hypothetical protein DM860_013260 [Cuscuta australis]|uniref:Single-stranded DNA-binding protein n=1 Tax=Cuscuta australis TaxID=267555 RepID=A0A328DNP7_9ASTE|nr:hypothetical protein DM860_013260 [Cuscuta australis]